MESRKSEIEKEDVRQRRRNNMKTIQQLLDGILLNAKWAFPLVKYLISYSLWLIKSGQSQIANITYNETGQSTFCTDQNVTVSIFIQFINERHLPPSASQ